MTFVDPGQQALDNIDATIRAAPEMSAAPGLTTDTALAGGNVGGSAQAVAQGAKSQVQATAANGVLGFLGGALHDVGKVLNAPLGVVQHTYRYLHDVEARHGPTAAILEGLGIAAGVAVGSVLTGGLGDLALGMGAAAAETGAADVAAVGTADAAAGAAEGGGMGAIDAANSAEDLQAGVSRSGGPLSKVIKYAGKALNPAHGATVLGGEAVGVAEGQTQYQDSWARTANGAQYRDPHTGQLVSFGRDIAGGWLHLDHKSSTYGQLSGILDGLVDINGDPLQAAAGLGLAAHTTEGVGGILGAASPRLSGYAMTADNLQRKYDLGSGPYHDALQFIADTKSGAKIRTTFPRFAPIVEDRKVLVGHETDVSAIPDALYYHGTAHGVEDFRPEIGLGSGSGNLAGPGFNVTNNAKVAITYSGKTEEAGGMLAKKVWGLKWGGSDAPRLLNFEAAGEGSDDLAQSMKEVLDRHVGDDASQTGEFAPGGTPGATEFWEAMNDPHTNAGDLYQKWHELMDNHYHKYEGGVGYGVTTPEMERLYNGVRDSLMDKGWDGFAIDGGKRIGGMGKHQATSFFDPTKLVQTSSTDIKNAHIETLMGLKNASTKEEAHKVFMDRSVLGTESIGHRLPTLSGAKLAMNALHAKAAEQPFDAAHPITGLLNPRTTVGNVQRLFSRVPVGVKGNLAKLDDNLVQGLIQFWSAGVGESAAHSAADLLPDLNLTGRRLVVRNMQLNTMAAMAGMKAPIEYGRLGAVATEQDLQMLDDVKVKTKMAEMIDKSFPTRDPDYMGLYGSRLDGKAPRLRKDPDSNAKFSSALLQSQVTNDYVIPDIKEFRSIAKLLRVGHDTLGNIDQALYDHITTRMKSLMLSTGAAYASHMALAEDTLNAQRLGLGNLIDGGLNASVQKSQWRALNANYNAIADAKKARQIAGGGIKQIGVVARSMRRAGRMLGVDLKPEQIAAVQRFAARSISRFVTEDDARYAAEFAIMTNGHMVDASLSGETSSGLDHTSQLNDNYHKLRMKLGDRYEQIERGKLDNRYTPEWQSWHRQIGKDGPSSAGAAALVKAHERGAKEAQAVKEARAAVVRELQALPENQRAAFDALQSKAVGSPKTLTPEQDVSHDIVENVRAATYSPRTMKPNGALLQRVANGKTAGLQELNSIPMEDRPLTVPGRVQVPAGGNLVDRITESDFQHIAQPVIKSLARMPAATAMYLKYRKAYEPMVAKGLITDEEAAIKASADTTIDMVRFIHNPEDRVQLDVLMRNWAPFLFAQNQAYRRGLRLMADDPAAFMRYYRSVVGVANVAHQMQDGTGNTYVSLPGAGYLTHPIVDAFGLLGGSLSINPTGFGGTLSSANVIFPLSAGPRPDLAPIVLIPAQAINGIMGQLGNSYPGWSKAAQDTTGALTWVSGKQAMSEGFLNQVIPNSILSSALVAAAGDGTSFNSAMMNTMQNLDYQQRVATAAWLAGGQKGPAPQILPNDQASVTQKQEFLQKLKNQTRIVWMVKTLLGGISPLGAAVQVNDFGFNQELQADINRLGVTNGYTAFLDKHPYATAYTAAKSDTAQGAPLPESQAAQDWVVQHSAQIHKDPAFLYFMPQTTNQTYDPSVYNEQVADGLRTRDTPQAFLDKLYTVAGDSTYYKAYDIHKANVANAGTNKSALTTEYTNWDSYLAYLQKVQPTWWASFNGGQKASDAVQSIVQLQQIYASGQAPNSPMGIGIEELLAALDEANTAYVQAGSSANYQHAQKLVRDNWQTQTAGWANANPALAPIITHLFRDALTYENPV